MPIMSSVDKTKQYRYIYIKNKSNSSKAYLSPLIEQLQSKTHALLPLINVLDTEVKV